MSAFVSFLVMTNSSIDSHTHQVEDLHDKEHPKKLGKYQEQIMDLRSWIYE